MFIRNKYLFFTLVLMFLTTLVRAQKQASDKIYWLALDKYTLALSSDNSPNLYSSKEKKIYLQKPEYVDSIPSKINGYDIILITNETQKNLYQAHNNKLVHTIMSPVAVEDSLLNIRISPYFGTLKSGKHYYLAVSDGLIVYFKYDYIKKQFVVFKVMNWGI